MTRPTSRAANKAQQAGFTLLEVMAATVIMAIAVAGFLANLQSSLGLTAHATTYKRATLFAQHKMDELIAAPGLQSPQQLNGRFEPAGSWRANISAFEVPKDAPTGSTVLGRIELLVDWRDGSRRSRYQLDGYRPLVLSR